MIGLDTKTSKAGQLNSMRLLSEKDAITVIPKQSTKLVS